MRYATVELAPVEGGFHPTDRQIVEDPSLSREAVDHLRRLTDGTGVVLFRVRGDADRVREVVADRSDVLDWDLTETEAEHHVYVHLEPDETLDVLFRLVHEHGLVLDTPIDCTSDGGLRVSAVGDDATFQRVIDAVPDDVRVELVEVGEYDPGRRRLASLLTDRQREILDRAVEAGYYDVPRRVTSAELADELDLSPATVGEHLRRIEGKVLRALSRSPARASRGY